MFTLRPYQQEITQAVKRDWEAGFSDVLVVAATGAGKTVVGLSLLNDVLTPGKRGLWLAHRHELISQPYERAQVQFPDLAARTGIVMADQDENSRALVIATIQTLASETRLRRLLANGKIDYVISDEAHHACAATNLGLYETLRKVNPAMLHLGMTATPLRSDGDGLSRVFKKVSAKFGIIELIQMGFLAPVRWLAIQTGISLKGIRTQAGDFSARQLADVYETGNCFDLVVESHKKYASDRLALAYTVSVQGAHDLAAAFNQAGIPAAAADGTTPKEERKAILRKFSRGEIRVLSNCLDEQTEILTQRGWVGMTEIQPDDLTAAVDMQSLAVAWEPITRIVRRKRALDEQMVRLKNQGLDVRVTEGHRMVFRTRGAKFWKIKEALNLIPHQASFQLPVAAFANPQEGEVPLPPTMFTKSGRRASMRYYLRKQGVPESELEIRLDEIAVRKQSMRYKTPKELTLAECQFIGLFITDGCMVKGGRGIEISQSHRYQKAIQEIETILNACGLDFTLNVRPGNRGNIHSPYKQNLYRVPIGAWGGKLIRDGYFSLIPYLEKDFSPLLFGLNREQTLALLRGLWLGDGSKNDRPGTGSSHWRITNTNLSMLERLQILCTLRGLQASLSPGRDNGVMATKRVYNIYIHDRQFIGTNNQAVPTSGGNPARFEENWQAEDVWCVTNQTGTIITRRNGKVLITGQCALFTEGLDVPEVSCIHQVRPTQSDGLYVQIIGRALRTYPGKTDALILDYAPKDARNIAMFGDILGVPLEKKHYLHPEQEETGEVQSGFTFDGEYRFLNGDPMEIVARELHYLELSPWSWNRTPDGWMTLGLGKASDEIERTLVIRPPQNGSANYRLYLAAQRPESRSLQAYIIQEGAFDTLHAWGEEYANRRGNAVLAAKKRGWRNEPPSQGQIQYAKRLGIFKPGLSKGDLANLITSRLATDAVERMTP